MNATKYIFLSLILYCFAINFSFANDDTLIISPKNDTPSYQTNHQPEKIVIHSNKKTENTNKIQFEDDNPDEEIINIEQNNHAKHESIPNRKTHSNIKKNNNVNIIEDDIASNINIALAVSMPEILGLIATAPVLIMIVSADNIILSSPAVTEISLLLMNAPCPV